MGLAVFPLAQSSLSAKLSYIGGSLHLYYGFCASLFLWVEGEDEEEAGGEEGGSCYSRKNLGPLLEVAWSPQ